MNWTAAQRILDRARGRREAEASLPEDGRRAGDRPGLARPARSLCIASGKGGTGKSVVTASLATLFARRGGTLILDGDLGVGNAHILQNSSPTRSLVEVVEGRLRAHDVIVPCGPRIDLLPAGCGISRMAELSSWELNQVALGLEELEGGYAFLLVDSAAGISSQTVAFARACDLVLLVTTPDITAMTDAYAFLKVLLARSPDARTLLVVNRATSEEEGREAAARVTNVARRFLGTAPEVMGWLPEDRAVQRSVNHRRAVVLEDPEAPASLALCRLAPALMAELDRAPARGAGRELVSHLGFGLRGG